ncbi:hypothetical protein PMM47T1_20993 [Pseudomonas sp. M47T1]|uniref:DUF2789 domain-containing protein n=1 Tax=unclassified Pseudomonas TaxID=196821 RepID=UPI000260761A|nr:DUF2789 domain-containing protein [Pseudomonas sp. M47T1]EIK94606.1 hypothetical protein PMM47T1_20993 [Pseudomonas sp. M47T1]
METEQPNLGTLFAQLGMDSDPASIDRFISAHPLQGDVKLIDAPFWNERQARFLKEELRADGGDWAIPIDELNVRLHQQA